MFERWWWVWLGMLIAVALLVEAGPEPAYGQSLKRCAAHVATAQRVGWPPKQLATLERVIRRESGCEPKAHNASDPNGGSFGLFQINGFWCKPSKTWPEGWLQQQRLIESCADLFDPTKNINSALAIWHNSGWSPWAI